MSPTEAARAFVQIVAQAEPHPGNSLERQVVNAARRITGRLHAEGHVYAELPAPLAPTSATGVPITKGRP